METLLETCYYLDHRPTVVLTGVPPTTSLKNPFVDNLARKYNALCVQRAHDGVEGEVVLLFATNKEAVEAWSGLWQLRMKEGPLVRSYLGRPLHHYPQSESMSMPLSSDERSWYHPSLDPHTLTTLAPRRHLDADPKHLAEWQTHRPFSTSRPPTRQPGPQPAVAPGSTSTHVPPAPTAAYAPRLDIPTTSYGPGRAMDSGWGARAAQGGSGQAGSAPSATEAGKVVQVQPAATGSAWRPAFASAPTSSTAPSPLAAIPIYRGVTAYERYTPDVKPRSFTIGHLIAGEWLLQDDEVKKKVEVWLVEVVTRIVEMHVWLSMEGYWLIRVVFDSEQMRSVVPISAIYGRAEGFHTKPKKF